MKRSAKQLITFYARAYGLDPRAVIAVAQGEGGLRNRPGSEDIGDEAGGGSYGPFQLYAQGALPAKYRGNPEAADAWAWSAEGIEYAIRQMAPHAKGLRGAKAIDAIVREFERPADPDKSVRNAVARYGAGSLPVGPPSPVPQSPVPTSPLGNPKLQAVFNQTNTMLGLPQLDFSMLPKPQTPLTGNVTASPGAPAGSLAQAMLQIIGEAQRRGLAVRENPYVDSVDPVHTKGSYHYRTFSGKYGGKQLGRGADISGNQQALAALFDWISSRYPKVSELIYDPRGSVFDGTRSKKPYGGHSDHLHVGL